MKIIRNIFLILLFVLVSSSYSDTLEPSKIIIKIYPNQLYDQIFGENAIGWCMYEYDPCTIYMRAIENYKSDECYIQVLNHEIRHCFEGPYHGNEFIDDTPACDE